MHLRTPAPKRAGVSFLAPYPFLLHAHADILVLGAGVVGLTSAIRLREAGHTVRVIAAARTPHTTSDRAGACFTPFRDDADTRPLQWSREGYRALCQLAREHSESAVRLAPMREFMYSPNAPVPWWGEIVGGCTALAAPAGFSVVYEALLPHIDMTRYVAWLEARAQAMGIPIESRRVASFDELFVQGASIIINCTGLGARELAADSAMTPMRGQILHVRNTLGLDFSLHDEPRGDVVTYIFAYPKHLVLGGTYEPGVTSDATEPDAIDAILDRCRTLLRADGHQRWHELGREEIKRVAGLRPARVVGGNSEAIRLEVEHSAPGRTIVHNYGHGRSGVTLSWGCAADVVCLVAGAEG